MAEDEKCDAACSTLMGQESSTSVGNRERVQGRNMELSDTKSSVENEKTEETGEKKSRLADPDFLKRLGPTFATFFMFFALGLGDGSRGPTLLDLSDHFQSTLQSLSVVYIFMSTGAISGAFLFGLLFNKLPIHRAGLMFFSISLVGITTALITSVGHLYIVYAISFIGGHGAGALETGGNVLILDVWRGHDSGPPLHMVHFGYAIGTVIGPLMAAPFLKEVASILDLTLNEHLGINATITSNVSNSSSAVLANDGEESRISIFYPILGGIVIISGLGLLAMEVHAIMTRRRKAKRNSGTDPKKEDTAKEQRTTVKIVVFVTLMCVFYFLYVGVEVVTGVYIASFAVLSDLKATQVQGAYVAAVFWGAFAAMRGVAIILAVYVDPLRTMLLSFSLCIGSGVALIFFAEHSFLTLAVLIAIMGCGMASIYATGLIWAEKYITVTNKIGSAFAMFAMAGPDVFPILMGSFIVETPMFLMYLILGTVSGCMGIFAFAAIVGRSILNDRRTERCENQDKVKVTALEVDLAK